MSVSYRVPAGTQRSETVVERSRFIATVGRATAPDAARMMIDRVRQEFTDASHNCWAYVAGPPASSAAVGFSDAGEPHGTAGRPMLDVLLHSGIGEIAVVVTRYFGGTKLGKGGLVRAYGGAVQDALAQLQTIELVPRMHALITLGYGDVEVVKRLAARHRVEVTDEQYGARVTYRVAVPIADVAAFRADVADATSGRAHVERAADPEVQ